MKKDTIEVEAEHLARQKYKGWPVATLLDAIIVHAFNAGHAAERKNWDSSDRENAIARSIRGMVMELTNEEEDSLMDIRRSR